MHLASSHLLSNYKLRRQFVRHLKSDDHLNYWADEVLEDVVGIPDILNEKLADLRVATVLARVKKQL